MKLYLGCAKPPFHPQHLAILGNPDDWVWVDLYVKHPRIKNWDATDLPVVDDSVEQIYASHLLEHLAQKEVINTLKHWRRKLIPTGLLIVNVPDLVWASERLIKLSKAQKLNGYYKDFAGDHGLMSIFYGSQDHPGEFHKSGFIKSSLKEYLLDAGYKNVEVKQEFEAHEMRCLIANAVK